MILYVATQQRQSAIQHLLLAHTDAWIRNCSDLHAGHKTSVLRQAACRAERPKTTKARFDGTTRVENHFCHRLVCERDTQTWTIYVEKESKLIRRIDSEVSEAQMRRLRKLGWGGGASGRVMRARIL